MIISAKEIADMIVMTAAVGFFFKDFFKTKKYGFDWNAFKFSCLITAPALIFHELAHKFFALYYGLQATFHAAYIWLGIGIVLRLARFPFIFFVPAYVGISGATKIPPMQMSLIAAAGPLTNLALFLIAWGILKKKRNLSRKTMLFLVITKQLNLFLFIFNMLPIPFFDGHKVFSGLIQALAH